MDGVQDSLCFNSGFPLKVINASTLEQHEMTKMVQPCFLHCLWTILGSAMAGSMKALVNFFESLAQLHGEALLLNETQF